MKKERIAHIPLLAPIPLISLIAHIEPYSPLHFLTGSVSFPFMKWHVYILKCKDGSLYTGITTDLGRRIKEHLEGKGGGYTRAHRPEKIVYSEKLMTRSAALKREARIKRMKRRDKIALIRAH